MRRGRRQRRPMSLWLGAVTCLSLAVVLVVGVLLVPLGDTIYRSFFSDGLNPKYVGFDNYRSIFHDPVLVKSLVNTGMWVVGSLVLPVGLGLGIAVMTNSLKWGKVARLAIILPYALSGTAVAVVGYFMLQTNGAINQMLGAVGLHSLEQAWLLHWPQNTISAILVSVWQSTGVAVVLFMVGLQGIPTETLEAAALDGASGMTRFRNIIVPQLRPVTAVVVGITLANALRAFDVTWVLTNGGPARSSETLALSMYSETFLAERPGVGAAIAILLTCIVLVSSWAYLRNQNGEVR
jgi:ABC-type sugar transport system permease subunit